MTQPEPEPKLRRHTTVTCVTHRYNGQLIDHVWDDYGNHAIMVDGHIGQWVTYRGIARNGPWYATTEYYTGELPRLFRVTEVKP